MIHNKASNRGPLSREVKLGASKRIICLLQSLLALLASVRVPTSVFVTVPYLNNFLVFLFFICAWKQIHGQYYIFFMFLPIVYFFVMRHYHSRRYVLILCDTVTLLYYLPAQIRQKCNCNHS